jgi:hypothetical protein
MRVNSGLDQALKSESTLHGIRVQSMFQAMVASFDKARMVKQEDSGECYHNCVEPVQIPDFRVVLEDGRPLLVETKNYFRTATSALVPFEIRNRDMGALTQYAMLMTVPLRFAIYWAHWNTWTLNDPQHFTRGQNSTQIEFADAVKTSEMADLGDVSIGTEYPLTLRLKAASDESRTISTEGQFHFSIGGVEVYCAGRLLEDPLERNIAFYLMMYGKWQGGEPRAELDESQAPTAVLYIAEPEDIHEGQGFEIIGSLSSMFSSFYNSMTLEETRVSNLPHYDDPARLAPIIPRDYKGKNLPLWRFIQQPNYEPLAD